MEGLVFGCFITNFSFFQPHFCDAYKDMKVLLAVYFFLGRALIDVKLARALVSVCFGPDLVVAVFIFFLLFSHHVIVSLNRLETYMT